MANEGCKGDAESEAPTVPAHLDDGRSEHDFPEEVEEEASECGEEVDDGDDQEAAEEEAGDDDDQDVDVGAKRRRKR